MSSWCGAQLSAGYIFMTWYLAKQWDTSTFLTYSLMIQELAQSAGYN